MRHIARGTLSNRTMGVLKKRTSRIAAAPDQNAAAEKAWRTRNAAADTEVQSVLWAMAGVLRRCMYCEDSEGVAIEHFRPRTSFPLKTFDWWNLLLACSYCNSNQKRTQFPQSTAGAPLLIDPTSENPALHLEFSPTTGQ